jgi:copper(I)-binding protein
LGDNLPPQSAAGACAALALISQPQGESMSSIPTLRSIALGAAALVLAAAAHAQVSVKEAWVRATVAQQKATGAFMQLTAAQDTQLISVSSPVAAVTEIHEMTMDGGVMKMHAVPTLALPAGKPVDLKPGSYHVMLLDLKAQVKEGDTVPVTLTLQGADGKRQTLEVKATARPLGAAMPQAGEHAGHMHHGQ